MRRCGVSRRMSRLRLPRLCRVSLQYLTERRCGPEHYKFSKSLSSRAVRLAPPVSIGLIPESQKIAKIIYDWSAVHRIEFCAAWYLRGASVAQTTITLGADSPDVVGFPSHAKSETITLRCRIGSLPPTPTPTPGEGRSFLAAEVEGHPSFHHTPPFPGESLLDGNHFAESKSSHIPG